MNMNVLKEKSREYNGKSYYKYKINIPEKILKKAGFKAGTKLKADAKKGEIKLRKWREKLN